MNDTPASQDNSQAVYDDGRRVFEHVENKLGNVRGKVFKLEDIYDRGHAQGFIGEQTRDMMKAELAEADGHIARAQAIIYRHHITSVRESERLGLEVETRSSGGGRG